MCGRFTSFKKKLFTRVIRINLYNIDGLSSHFSFQLNKRIFQLLENFVPFSINVHEHDIHVKLWFTNKYFVGFYSVPNLIVILFNLLYPIFVVGIYYKGCVIVRESVKTQAIEDWRVFASISRLSIPRKEACALHMIGMRRVRPDGDSCVSRVSCG